MHFQQLQVVTEEGLRTCSFCFIGLHRRLYFFWWVIVRSPTHTHKQTLLVWIHWRYLFAKNHVLVAKWFPNLSSSSRRVNFPWSSWSWSANTINILYTILTFSCGKLLSPRMAWTLPEKDIIKITFRFFWPGRQIRPLLLDSPKLVLPAHLFKQKPPQNFQSFPGRWDFAGTHGEWSSLFVEGRGTFRLDGSQNFDGRSENPQMIKDELRFFWGKGENSSSYHGNRWSKKQQ